MRKLTLATLLLAFAGTALAVDPAEQAIDLKNGGKLSIEKKGTMTHVDAAGNRVRMRDGVAMEGKDGSMYMMKNNAIWKQITEKGTLRPN